MPARKVLSGLHASQTVLLLLSNCVTLQVNSFWSEFPIYIVSIIIFCFIEEVMRINSEKRPA